MKINYKLTIFVLFSLVASPVYSRLTVFVSIIPQSYIVKAIAGDKVEIKVLIGKGQTPHSFKPTPRQITDLSKANLFFRIGASFENQIIKKIKNVNRQLLIADMSNGVRKRRVEEHGHEHGGDDPHIWLSPLLIKKQAQNVARVLSELDLNNRSFYNQRYKEFIALVEKEYVFLVRKLLPYSGSTIFVYHPAFGYFLEAFGLKQKSVEIEGKSPTPKALTNLIKQMRKHNSNVIFVQPQFSKDSAQVIANAVDGQVVFLDPLSENLLESFTMMADKIVSALEKRKQ